MQHPGSRLSGRPPGPSSSFRLSVATCSVLATPVAQFSRRIFVQRPCASPSISATLWQRLQLPFLLELLTQASVPFCLPRLDPVAPPIRSPSSFVKYSPCSDSGPRLAMYFFISKFSMRFELRLYDLYDCALLQSCMGCEHPAVPQWPPRAL